MFTLRDLLKQGEDLDQIAEVMLEIGKAKEEAPVS